jgi:hypothetical protein
MEVDMNSFVDKLKDAGLSSEEIKSIITNKIHKETKALEVEALKIQADKETKALEIQADKEAKIKIELAKINASKSQVIYIFSLIKIINISCILLTMFLYLLKSDMELSFVNAFSALLANRIGTLNVFPNKSYNAAITSLFCAIAAAALTYAFVWLRACLISLRTQEPETEHESQGLLEGAR